LFDGDDGLSGYPTLRSELGLCHLASVEAVGPNRVRNPSHRYPPRTLSCRRRS
jgi:hypothetical protein